MLPNTATSVFVMYNRNAKLAFKTNRITCLSTNRGSKTDNVPRRTNYKLAEKDVIRVPTWQKGGQRTDLELTEGVMRVFKYSSRYNRPLNI